MRLILGLTGLGVLILAAATGKSGTADAAEPVANFYRGKTIELIAAGAPATGQDTWARMMTRYLTKYIPGNPGFIVKNMPGSGHIKATDYLFRIAPQDGTTIGTISSSVLQAYVLKQKGLEFDIPKFNWLGSPESPHPVCIAASRIKISTNADLLQKEIAVGGTGPTGGISMIPTMARKLLGMKLKLVDGYPGPGDILVAIERNELDGICGSLESLTTARPAEFANGTLKVLFNLQKTRLPGIDAPSIFEFAKTEEDRKILSFFGGRDGIGRPFLIPPNVPADRVEALRRGFDKTMADPDFKADAERRKLTISAITGEQLTDNVNEYVSVSPDTVRKTMELLGVDRVQ